MKQNMNTVKERPILFSGPMVRAILAGEKTQTRRVVKPQPFGGDIPGYNPIWGSGVITTPKDPKDRKFCIHARFGNIHARYGYEDKWLPSPYGKPGDRLWVRETWGAVCDINKEGPPERFHLNYDDVAPKEGMRWYADYIIYAADPEPWEWYDDDGGFTEKSFWKPSIHMPRWASRLLLEVTSVRLERLQDISEADALAEGIQRFEYGSPMNEDGFGESVGFGTERLALGAMSTTARQAYKRLWISINGPKSWAANPWVWVVEFRRI